MDERRPPLPSDRWGLVPPLAQTLLLEQFAAMHAEKQALQARIRGGL